VESELEYKELGKTGIRISAIGIGTWQWGSREWGWSRTYGKRDLLEALHKALELGINLVDTAEIYGKGKSEELIGEAIQGHREEVVIATKVSPMNLTYGRALRAADRSIRRLRVDVIDLYQIHWPNPFIPIRNTMKALKQLVEAGKVRCIGVSNFNLEKMKAAQDALPPSELASNQVKYNLLDRRVEKDLLPYTNHERITVIAYSPLAQGLLTGKYSPESLPQTAVQSMNARFSPANLSRLGKLTNTLLEIARAHGKTSSQVALNWLIRKENVVAIPGVKRPEHVLDNVGATDLRLTQQEIEKLETIASKIRFSRLSGLPNLLRAFTRV